MKKQLLKLAFLLFLLYNISSCSKKEVPISLSSTNYGMLVVQGYLNKAKTFYLNNVSNTTYAVKNV